MEWLCGIITIHMGNVERVGRVSSVARKCHCRAHNQ